LLWSLKLIPPLPGGAMASRRGKGRTRIGAGFFLFGKTSFLPHKRTFHSPPPSHPEPRGGFQDQIALVIWHIVGGRE